LGAIVNVVANLLLIPYWQATGSAAAMVIAELVIFLFLLSKVKRFYSATWLDRKFLVWVSGSNLAMAAGIFGIRELLQVHVGILVIMGALIYIGVSWPFFTKFVRRTGQI